MTIPTIEQITEALEVSLTIPENGERLDTLSSLLKGTPTYMGQICLETNRVNWIGMMPHNAGIYKWWCTDDEGQPCFHSDSSELASEIFHALTDAQ